MKHLQRMRHYLGAQPIKHLWTSSLVILACFVGSWYTWGYRPLICAAHNLEERLALCTQACDKDSHEHTTFKNLEENYKKTVSLLRDYKGDRDAQTFYHHAVDQLLTTVRSAQCSLISFSSGVDVSQPLYQMHQATIVCDGTREAVTQCLNRLSKDQSPWRVTTVTFEMGHDAVCHLSLGLQCLVLV